jgi:hypothetical protein
MQDISDIFATRWDKVNTCDFVRGTLAPRTFSFKNATLWTFQNLMLHNDKTNYLQSLQTMLNQLYIEQYVA